MTENRSVSWINAEDADICLIHDLCGRGSEIEVSFKDGGVVGLCVEAIDKAGLPSSAGTPPSLADLKRLGGLLAKFSKPLGDLGFDGKCRLAMEMNSDLDPASSGFEWIDLMEKAESYGIHVGAPKPTMASFPSP